MRDREGGWQIRNSKFEFRNRFSAPPVLIPGNPGRTVVSMCATSQRLTYQPFDPLIHSKRRKKGQNMSGYIHTCDECGSQMQVHERYFGRELKCTTCRAEFVARSGGRATVMPLENPAFEKARQALSDEWGTEAAFIGCGGSIPVVGQFMTQLGMHSLLIGFGLDDDCIHSPNEKYEMASFTKGARSWARVLAALAG